MDDLARELGISKKTIYNHFPSKVALVEAVVLDKLSDIETKLERIASERSGDFLTELHTVLGSLTRHLEEIRPPFVRDVHRDLPQVFKLVENRRRDLARHHFGRLLSEGRKEGTIRKDVPTELVIEMLLAAVHGIMNSEKLAELGLTPKEGFSAIMTVILEGAITQTGRTKP